MDLNQQVASGSACGECLHQAVRDATWPVGGQSRSNQLTKETEVETKGELLEQKECRTDSEET